MSGGYLMEQPLVIQGTREEAGGLFGNATPLQFMPSQKNYAKDQKTADFFRNEIASVQVWTRQNRLGQQDEWMNIRNMNAMVHDSGRRYFGRSDAYLPVYKRERQKLIATLSKGLFPSDEYFDVTDMQTGDPEQAKPVKALMQWDFERNARLKAYMKPFLGQLVDYGTSPMKFWYKKNIRREGGVTKKSSLGNLINMQYGFKPVANEGMAVSPRNLLYWYIYPETCESLNDAMMVFEDIDVPWAFVEWMHKCGRWANVEDAVESASSLIVPEHQLAQVHMLYTRGDSFQVPGQSSMGKTGSIMTFTEAYCYMPLPDDAYMPDEYKGMPLPVMVTSFGDTPVDIRRNPFFHQRPPYVVARIDWEPGFFYGNAQGRIIRPLQLLSNDFMNQTNDNGIIGMNPIAIIDVNKMAGAPTSYYPGAAWYTLGPDAVKFDRPPIDQVQMGMQMTREIAGMAQDAGGAPPDFSNKSKASSTATGMSIAQRNTAMPLQDVVEDIEVDAMVEMLTMGWKNNIQYRDEAVMASVAGQAIRVTPEMLAIDAQFRWLASSQAQNAQVRTQQAMSLIQMITPIVPLIMQQGYIIDFVALVKKIYTDGMGFRGFQEFIRKAQAVPGAGAPTPGQMPGVQAEQGDRLRSALEQVNGMNDPNAAAQPGETEDFSQVRNEADQNAAMMGGMGGGMH